MPLIVTCAAKMYKSTCILLSLCAQSFLFGTDSALLEVVRVNQAKYCSDAGDNSGDICAYFEGLSDVGIHDYESSPAY